MLVLLAHLFWCHGLSFLASTSNLAEALFNVLSTLEWPPMGLSWYSCRSNGIKADVAGMTNIFM